MWLHLRNRGIHRLWLHLRSLWKAQSRLRGLQTAQSGLRGLLDGTERALQERVEGVCGASLLAGSFCHDAMVLLAHMQTHRHRGRIKSPIFIGTQKNHRFKAQTGMVAQVRHTIQHREKITYSLYRELP